MDNPMDKIAGADAEFSSEMTMMPLSAITAHGNPRRFFSPDKHAELVASLRLRGMLQPILLRPGVNPQTFAIVAGERRYRAALEVFGPDGEVPAIVRDMTDREALEAAIDENDVREDASETEQADAAVRVLAACQDDRAEAARRLGWSVAKLDRRLALASLSDAVKAALDQRQIKVGHAELLAAVPADKQDTALGTILTAALDVGKTRELLQRVTQNLATALFDKTECASCGYNSARQRALFETHVDDGHCTNGACFALKLETAERARQEVVAKASPDSGAANGETVSEATVPSDADHSSPDNSPGPSVGQGSTPSAPSDLQNDLPATDNSAESLKSGTKAPPAAPAKPKVTAEALAAKHKPVREAAWRRAVAAAITDSADHVRVADLAASYVESDAPMPFSTVDALAIEFEVDLRTSWQVNGTFLAGLSKEELKFVAQECGLVEHMGEKAFAKLLAAPASDLITGMLHVTGFDWSGRLPSAMAIDGQYGPPPAAAEAPTETMPVSEED